MKKTDMAEKIIQFGKVHWLISAMSLFLILTGIICSIEIYGMLEKSQKQQIINIALLSNSEKPFGKILFRRIVIWSIQSLFSAYLLCMPGYWGIELFGIVWRSVCWQIIVKLQNWWIGALCLSAAVLCMACEDLQSIYALLRMTDYYKKQYRELHVPKSAQEVRQDSFRQIIKMFSLLVIVLPVWCLEIGIWMYLWE